MPPPLAFEVLHGAFHFGFSRTMARLSAVTGRDGPEKLRWEGAAEEAGFQEVAIWKRAGPACVSRMAGKAVLPAVPPSVPQGTTTWITCASSSAC